MFSVINFKGIPDDINEHIHSFLDIGWAIAKEGAVRENLKEVYLYSDVNERMEHMIKRERIFVYNKTKYVKIDYLNDEFKEVESPRSGIIIKNIEKNINMFSNIRKIKVRDSLYTDNYNSRRKYYMRGKCFKAYELDNNNILVIYKQPNTHVKYIYDRSKNMCKMLEFSKPNKSAYINRGDKGYIKSEVFVYFLDRKLILLNYFYDHDFLGKFTWYLVNSNWRDNSFRINGTYDKSGDRDGVLNNTFIVHHNRDVFNKVNNVSVTMKYVNDKGEKIYTRCKKDGCACNNRRRYMYFSFMFGVDSMLETMYVYKYGELDNMVTIKSSYFKDFPSDSCELMLGLNDLYVRMIMYGGESESGKGNGKGNGRHVLIVESVMEYMGRMLYN